MNYIESRRTTVWSYEFRRRIDGRVSPAEATGPYEKLPIPTNLDIVHITLLVVVSAPKLTGVEGKQSIPTFIRGNLFFFHLMATKITTQFVLISNIKELVY